MAPKSGKSLMASSDSPLKNIILVENHLYLVHDEDRDDGYAVAIVGIIDIQPWTKDMFLQQNLINNGIKVIMFGIWEIFEV